MVDIAVPETSSALSPQNIALPWLDAGCSVVPIKPGGQKRPYFEWKTYQHQLPTQVEVQDWFENRYRYSGVAVICGAVSGGLEMLELEGRAVSRQNIALLADACNERGIGDAWNQLVFGYREESPSGGVHFLYRIRDHAVPSNRKLAMRPAFDDELTDMERDNPHINAVRVLAETRGEGGYVIVAPTGGHCHFSGKPWVAVQGRPDTIPTLDWETRNLLHDAITSVLDETPPATPVITPSTTVVPRSSAGFLSPADDFNLRAQWTDDWFTTSVGWTIHHTEGNETFWTRPGKDPSEGHSATTGRANDADRLWIWSTSTTLPAETPHSKFYVYAHYQFGGDMKAAAAHLRTQGYGSTPPPALQPFNPNLPATGQSTIQPGPGMDFSNLTYARHMRAAHGSRFRYSTLEKKWYVWNGNVWEKDETKQVYRAMIEIADEVLEAAFVYQQQNPQDREAPKQVVAAKAARNHTSIEASLSSFSAQLGIAVTPDMFDRNTNLLNLTNGTFNLVTKQLMEANPDDMITMTFAADHNPEAQCPKWLQFMADVFPDDGIRDYIQRALGYTLLGKPTERAMFLLHGPSGTGKSVLTTVMTKLFGDYGTTAPASTFRLKRNDSTTDVHTLRGKRWVGTSEMPEGAQLDDELVKRITGGDTIMSRNLYEAHQNWRAMCVVWIATNFLPRVSSDDNAVWRRAKSIPMLTEFGGPNGLPEIKGFADILLHERDGIFNWLLEGLAKFQAEGHLTEPEPIKQDIADYRVDSDSVASWVRDAIGDGQWALQRDARADGGSVYDAYSRYCTDWGNTPLSRRRFTHRLSSLGLPIELKKIGVQRWWLGLANLETGQLGD